MKKNYETALTSGLSKRHYSYDQTKIVVVNLKYKDDTEHWCAYVHPNNVIEITYYNELCCHGNFVANDDGSLSIINLNNNCRFDVIPWASIL